MRDKRTSYKLCLLGITALSCWVCTNLVTFAYQLGYRNFYQLLVLKLQMISIWLTVFLLRGFGLRVSANGFIIDVDNHGQMINIARECSGINSLTALTVIAALIVFYYCKAGWRGKLQVYLSFVPIAIIGNTFRIMSNAVIKACGVDPGLADLVHDLSGWIYYALDIVLICLVGKLAEMAYPKKQK